MDFLRLKNCESVLIADVPQLQMEHFREVLKDLIKLQNCRVGAFFAHENVLYAVVIDQFERCFKVVASALSDKSYKALTPDIEAFHWFERELYEQTGIKPEGHPWLKPLRFEAEDKIVGVTDYFTMQGCAGACWRDRTGAFPFSVHG